MPRADQDLVTHLAAAGVGLTAGTNLFRGPVRGALDEVPGEAVFVLLSGGFREGRIGNARVVRDAAIQIVVRGKRDAFEAGITLARNVWDAVHYAVIAGYLDVQCDQGEPLYLGETEDGRHQWAVNATMAYVDDTQ